MESNKDAGPAPPAMPRPAPPLGFPEFFRERYRPLIRIVMNFGATREQAEDAVAFTMEDLLRRWEKIKNPLAYARQAAVHNFFKAKTRYQDRHQLQGIREQCPEPTADSQVPDPTAIWEDHQWVNQLLDSLTPTQREVMSLTIDGLPATEIAELLGKTPEAVRQNRLLARRRLRQHELITDLHVSHMHSSREKDAR